MFIHFSYNEQDRVSDYHHSHTTSKDVCDMVDSRNKKSLNTGETTDNQRNNITPVQAPLDAFKDSPSRPPTESDVQAILSIAGTCNTGSIDLKKEKMRQKRKPSKKPKPKLSNTETTSSKLQSDTPTALNNTRIPLKTVESDKIAVRHGSAEPITTTSMLLSEHYSKKDKSEKPLRHKRRHSVLEDDNSDSENEHIDVEGGFVPRLTVDNSPCDTQSTMKQPFYATSVNDDSTKEKSFVVHYPLKQLSLKCTKLPIDVRTNEQRMDDNVSSDGNVHIQQQKQKKEKKEKKEKKHRRHKKKELKLKIRLNADHSENSTDD